VLDDVAVLVYAEDVDAGVLMVAGPDMVTVQNDIVVLGECPLELDELAWVLGCHALDVVDEARKRIEKRSR
jgi:hypothetical protein